MSNGTTSLAHDPGTLRLAGLQISQALYTEIKEACPDDMPMVLLSAIAELGFADARHLVRMLCQEDPAWIAALAEPRPTPLPESAAEPTRRIRTKRTWTWDHPDLSLHGYHAST